MPVPTFTGMPRRKRPHLPGAVFHLTARLLGGEALFTPRLRTVLVRLLRRQVAFADLQLLAYVIMPNHLHLVVRQGRAPLFRFMQPLLCRTALLIQRSHGKEGHVFVRRYWAHPCGDAEYIRNAIIYTHLNPVRAELSVEPEEYPWSSHGAWLGNPCAVDGRPHPVALSLASQIFASAPGQSPKELAGDYLAFLRWRREQDVAQARIAAGDYLAPVAPRPVVGRGDESWVVHLSPKGEHCQSTAVVADSDGFSAQTPRSDLETIARGVVGRGRGKLDLDLVRSRWGGAPFVRARYEIIRRAAAVGYRGVEIAAYLRISPKTVSAVLTAERQKLLSSLDTQSGPANTSSGQL